MLNFDMGKYAVPLPRRYQRPLTDEEQALLVIETVAGNAIQRPCGCVAYGGADDERGRAGGLWIFPHDLRFVGSGHWDPWDERIACGHRVWIYAGSRD